MSAGLKLRWYRGILDRLSQEGGIPLLQKTVLQRCGVELSIAVFRTSESRRKNWPDLKLQDDYGRGFHRGRQRPDKMDASSWKDKQQQSKCDIQHGNRWENPQSNVPCRWLGKTQGRTDTCWWPRRNWIQWLCSALRPCTPTSGVSELNWSVKPYFPNQCS